MISWRSKPVLSSLERQNVKISTIPRKRLFIESLLFCMVTLGYGFGQVSLPYTQNFDSATPGNPGTLPTGWVNVATDGSATCGSGGAAGHSTCHNWQVNTGATPSPSPIGPVQDHTSGSGNYIYYEDSGNNNSTVEILTPTFNLSGTARPRVSFYTYNHYFSGGGAPNTMSMDVMNAAGTVVVTSNVAVFPTDFAEWMYKSVDLSAYTGSGTIRLRFRVNINGGSGRHDIAIDDFAIRDEPAPVVDPAICTPIDNSRGSILSNHANRIYSVNLATGKATLLTTAPVANINSLAIDTVNQLIYYVETLTPSSELRAWNYATDTHLVIDSDLSDDGVLIGSTSGLGGGAAGWSSNGSLYMGIEEGTSGDLNNGLDLVYRLDFVPGSGGLTVAGGRLDLQITAGGTHDWGDLVVIGNTLYDFSPNSNTFGRMDLTTLAFTATTGVTGLSQAGSDRLGGLWSVSTTIQRRNTTTGATIGSPVNITTDGTTGIGSGSFDSAGCVPATSSIGSFVWHDTNSNGLVDGIEIGISGVTLEIYDDINGNGQIDFGDTLLGTTVTDGVGSYTFSSLLPGDYVIAVDTSSLPVGSVNTFDEDDGTSSPDDMTGVGVTINETYGSADFGYLVPTTLTADKTVAFTADNDSTGTITPGDILTYTIQLQNSASGGAATGITVLDVVPSGLTYVAASIAGGDSRNDSDPDGSIIGAPDGLQWSVATLNPNTSVVLTFQVQVGFGAAGMTLNNQATITGSNFVASVSDDPTDPTNDPAGPGDPGDPTPVTVTSPDNDNDGIPDHLDIDDDNDGIPDVSEAGGNNPNGDEDGDSIPNWQDTTDNDPGNTLGDGSSTDYTDADSNGIPDVFDVDRDGIANHLDIDADNDGIPDLTEAGGTDADNDGIEDTMYDTDNDSIPDSVDVDQTGGADANTDGIDDSFQGGLDSDGDGIQDSSDPDADGDGLADVYDNINSGGIGEVTSGTPLANADSDSDGFPNALDIDADDDGIPDNIEAQTTLGYIAPTGLDSDGDGLDNAYDPDNNSSSGSGDGPGTPHPITNFDGTDEPDYLDQDSDNDNIPDIRENGIASNTLSGIDTDNDGLDDNFEGGNLNDPSDVNDEINAPVNDLPDGDGDRNSGGDMDYRDVVELESYSDNGYGSLDQVYYRQTNGTIDEFFVGGAGFPAVDPAGYDVAYYDSTGTLVFTDSNATVDGSGFVESEYTVSDGLDPNNLEYGTWTAVVLFDGVTPNASLATQLASPSTIITDAFDVYSLATINFTDPTGTPVTGYDVAGGEDTAYLEIVDPDQNTNGAVVDSIDVTVTDSDTGDSVTVTLFETGPDTGVFAYSSAVSGTRLGIPLAFCPNVPPDPANTGDSTLCVLPTSTLEATYSDPNDPGPVQDVVTNPVTVNAFSTDWDRVSGEWIVRWSTATEAGNIGFNLYSLNGTQLQKLNVQPIPSKVVDSVEDTHYEYRAKVQIGDALVLEDVDVFGSRQSHGPFEREKAYGGSQPISTIDWAAIRQQHEYQRNLRRNEARGVLRNTNQLSARKLYVKTQETGVYRLTYEALLEAGFDMKNLDLRALALTLDGQPVPIYIGSEKGQAFETAFGPGSYIAFLADAHESLYSKTNVYLLEVNPAAAQRMAVIRSGANQDTKVVTEHRKTQKEEPENLYSFSSPNGDPWFAERLLAWNQPLVHEVTLWVDNLANGNTPSELFIDMWGVTDWPSDQDHHVKVYFNGVMVGDARFDGLVHYPMSMSLPPGLVSPGENKLGFELPLDTGQPYDLVHLDHWALTYNRNLVAEQNRLQFSGAGKAFQVSGFESSSIEIFQRTSNGTVSKITHATGIKTGSGYSFQFEGASTSAVYYLVGENSALVPQFDYVPETDDLQTGLAEYLIISHPDFLGASLNQLVSLREMSGYSVKVVNLDQIYSAFSHGKVDPEAIRAYIAFAASKLRTKMVLLVGGDTHDYHGYLNEDAISFIPTLYAQTDPIVSFAPVDALFTDLDSDNLPDLAIGRFPVRTEVELSIQVQKIEWFEENQFATALFAADQYDRAQDYSFSVDSDIMAGLLPSTWQVSKIYLDHIDSGSARTHLVNAINLGLPRNGNHYDLSSSNRTGGLSLVSFAGHSGPKDWTFSGLFGSGDAARLVNDQSPAMFIQWGCWNTYFVAPRENTMGHELMLNPSGGAVGVLGASTLTEAKAERELARALYSRLFVPGTTLGEAVLQAKRAFAKQYPEQLDVILGWTTLADPALVIQP